MKPRVFFPQLLFIAVGILMGAEGLFSAPRQGTVEWSDGKKISGSLSLSPGKDIRIFSSEALRMVRLDDVREIQMEIEKEEMFEGFTFPEAGKAIKEKTGEIYPVRHFNTKLLLLDGKTIEGHLYTTTLYLESEEGTRKVVLFAKMKGEDKQKLSDLVFPLKISFVGEPVSSASTTLDLTKAGFPGILKVIVLSKPDLNMMETIPQGKNIWRIPIGDPSRLICAVDCEDGLHVAWPDAENPESRQAVEASLKDMTDFYDKVQILGTYSENENTDVYALAMLSREGKTHSFANDKIPWTVAVLRWKYDSEEKKTTLLNRMQLITGRKDEKTPFPNVVKDASMLRLLHSSPAGGKEGK